MVNGLGFSPKNILLMKEFSLYTADEGVLPLWKGVVPVALELWLSTWECLLPMIRVLTSSRIPLTLEQKFQIGLILMVPVCALLSVRISSQIESLIPFSIDLASYHMALRGGGRKLPMEDMCYYEWPISCTDQVL
ncbi:hypothetical protein ACFE04_014597 [Oxalis oulophora]